MQSSLYGNSKAAKVSTNPTNRYEHMEEEIHRENESMLRALGSSVAHMKAMAGHLNREAEEQNELLKSLDKVFQTARGGVNSAVSSVKSVMGRYGWKHTAAFGCMGFFLLYFIYVVFLKRV
ncbi:putative Qc-SNARE protein [Leishmania major strain Friedlin]|uniref:Putative Qc-SNARE protein n=1 Tax=Leishmania major TaxID=5664 RepID=Q4QA87_LEIMA|nr:putative Qc-SNARE protein [Leishmania major strain Friedlin]CAG9575017.1 Qc-SNARE_protein_-_putative [Leishmania major strain Friedlin]CAJ04404.1 putative Qc-SNARE protein [Leishmania major strain Friedlin]|eukprot:XP_001683761.1 putative Qc-SNARE protein [Leishmania major strain Friedlin]